MKLLIEQRVFALGDTYDIYDEDGAVKYMVKAELIALGHQMHVYDAQHNEIGQIKQKLLTVLPKFDIIIHGQSCGRIEKKFTLFYPKYEIDFNGWRVEGDLLGWDYDVYSGNDRIMHISKELFHWGDTCVIDIANPSDELYGMMLVIALDAANCSNGD